MGKKKLDIYVFADWEGLSAPMFVGTLSAHFARGRKSFSFEYDKAWLHSGQHYLLDPDIQLFSGHQFPNNKDNFGVFLDSMPDTWGCTLMQRRAANLATNKGERAAALTDIDYLLGVFDESRIGALRFKTDINGPFFFNSDTNPTQPWSSIRDLQYAARQFEEADGSTI